MSTKNYIDEMFDYLCQPENYLAANELVTNLEMVDNKLINSFWHEVTNEIIKKVRKYERLKDVNIDFISNEINGSLSFTLRKDDVGFYYISTDRDNIGITIEEGIKMPKNRERMIKDELGDDYVDLNWICYETFDAWKFDTYEEKAKILPSVRKAKIIECSREIFNYLERLIDKCEIINKRINS